MAIIIIMVKPFLIKFNLLINKNLFFHKLKFTMFFPVYY